MPSYASITGGSGPTVEPILQKEYLDMIQTNIVKVSNMCDKVVHDFSKSGVDPALFVPFNGICEAIKLIVNVQEEVLNAISISNAATAAQATAAQATNNRYGTISSKKPRGEFSSGNFTGLNLETYPKRAGPNGGQQEDQVLLDPKVQKFKEAVKEAEKSTLLFNLNMGKVPIMNKDSMSTRATVSLTEMAAAVEGKPSAIPGQDTIATIDDCLSMVKSMSFFGRTTKTYRNSKDPKSGSFCTIPVRYTFQNKDTRIQAETTLREKCKVNCSTPYPTILREAIRQVVAHVKGQFPEDKVRVAVDTTNLGLKISRKPPDYPSWKDYKPLIPLPEEVFDVAARSVPLGFKVTGLPEPDPAKMDTTQNNSGPATSTDGTGITSPRMSRQDAHNASKANSPKGQKNKK